MEVKMAHPNNKDGVIIATHPQMVAAFKAQGFVEVVDVEKGKK